ncbi:TPA: lysine 2,3-aminomutase [Candidatus Uhrbacteria bacterium]|nr:lysine 2,3-aminomutase [Candidatus Uhrbacteria bacterium]
MQPEQWQIDLQHCVRTLDQLEQYIPIQNKERMREVLANMRLSITPHTLRLIDFENPNDPILLMSVPQERELTFSPEELVDPIGDEAKSPIPFLTHRYPDRVLIYATFFCSLFCRFCFRRSKTGEANPGPTNTDMDRIINYLHEHPEVEEVILTGGDPLTLLDWQIEDWLSMLRQVPSVRRIRFHTRTLVNLPSRITDGLLTILRRYIDATHPIFIVTHFNHPKEIAPENITAVARLVDMGIVVRNQGPLLKDVNDDPAILEELFKRLVDIRVVPYYLHQLDLAQGTNHFRVPIEEGIAIMRSLQGKVTGIALPRYMLDLPGGKGKIPLTHQFAHRSESSNWDLESPFGESLKYHEPNC